MLPKLFRAAASTLRLRPCPFGPVQREMLGIDYLQEFVGATVEVQTFFAHVDE